MLVIKLREEYEKVKKFDETIEEFVKNKLKEKLNKQIFYHDIQETFQQPIDQQK